MKEIDLIELAMKVQPYLRDGIRYEEMTMDQKLEAYKQIYGEEVKIIYSGYGYHGGGRKATGVKRVSICISGQPEQIEKLKELAALDRKTVSAFIFEKTGVNKMNEKIWFVANDDGEVIGHDMTEARAKALAEEMQAKEPDAGWEALNGDEE